MADVLLHNRPEADPSPNDFIVYGTPTTPSGMVKLSNFYTLLMGRLGFFKVSSLFSEIFGNPTQIATAQSNLDVYGKIAMDGFLDIVAYADNVIEKDSTISYTPTITTHPANKGYVDSKVLWFGTSARHDDAGSYACFKKGGVFTGTLYQQRPDNSSRHVITHNIGHLNYMAIIQSNNAAGSFEGNVSCITYSANAIEFYGSGNSNNSSIGSNIFIFAL
jgi:hypothetical protein